MEQVTNKLLYLRDCYEADSRGSIISNIFDRKIESKVYLEYEELMNGLKPSKKIGRTLGAELRQKAYMHRKDMELLYCSTFLLGIIQGNNDDEIVKVCAPLFLYPAEIDAAFTLTIDPQNMRINFGLLSMLYNEDNKSAINLYDQIVTEVNQYDNKLHRDPILNTAALLEDETISIDTTSFTLYPVLVTDKTLKKEYNKLSGKKGKERGLYNFTLYNAGVAALVKKSKPARGVIEEISGITNSNKLSRPIEVLFNKKINSNALNKRHEKTRGREGRTPAILSRAQTRIMESCKKEPLTLVVGPPGTGKSFTIASIALEHLSRGESVLIASKMDHAVDVVGDIIESQLGAQEVLVRGGDKQYLKKLKDYLKNLLHRMVRRGDDSAVSIEERLQAIQSLEGQIEDIERTYTGSVSREKRWGKFLLQYKLGIKKHHVINRYRFSAIREKRKDRPMLMKLISTLENLHSTRNRYILDLIKKRNNLRIEYTLNQHREDLVRFNKALQGKTGGKQEELFKQVDFKNLLETFPIWLVNLADIYTVLPLEQELFDLAIIDEATQCDMASCIPILYRARRVLIVGDPNQLRHISFLSKYRQFVIGNEYSLGEEEIKTLDYRNKSILDFVSESLKDKKDIFFLDEHYRSLPEIIAFSNSEFYNNSLRIMTEKPRSVNTGAIEIIPCKGTRDREGINEEEAKQVIKKISEIAAYEKDLDRSMSRTVGVLSPFRAQVDYIYQKLLKKFSIGTLEKHGILVGTAYTFQGEERDIMLLSFTVDAESHMNTYRFLSKDDILNVSITRARVKQYLYISFEPEMVKKEYLVRKYLEYVTSHSGNRAAGERDLVVHDEFMREVREEFTGLNIDVFPAYEIAGLTIDLVIEHNNITYGIDLVGYPGEFVESFSLERYNMYYRAGLKILPLSYSAWCFNKEDCIDEIIKKIEYSRTRS
ncbi:MAG: hypothetical protein GY754_18265 [bacterium]|nr:hypothetical protein [bacterium]